MTATTDLDRPAPTVVPKRPPGAASRWLRQHLVLILGLLVLLYTFIPIGIIILMSFNDQQVRNLYQWDGFTLDNWLNPCADPSMCDAVKVSIAIGLLATLVATLLGTLAAFALVRHQFVGRSGTNMLIFMPMAAPEIVMGSSLLALFVASGFAGQLGFWTIFVAHVMFCLSFVVVTVRARLAGLDNNLEQAAMDLYATPQQTFWRVTFPLVFPGILGAALLAFSLSFDDFIITNLNAGNTTTFPMYVWGSAQRGVPMQVNVVGTLMFVIAIVIVLGCRGQPATTGEEADVSSTIIGHWHEGAPWPGAAERRGDVYDPATGAGDRPGRLRLGRRGGRGRRRRRQGRAGPGRRPRSPSAPPCSSASATRSSGAARRSPRRSPPSTARCSTTPSARCSAASRSRSSPAARPHLLKGGHTDAASTGVDVHSLRQALGVVAVISPFNFPAMVPLWFVPVAIACGNAVVLKPSEKDPSTSLLLAECWAEAGLPPGVFNVVQGDKVAVDALLEHPQVAAVSFVGSTPIARYVYETGTAHGKRVQALGGAKNHMVVLPDADLDDVADAAVSAGFGSAGERCMAISVVVAVDPVGDELVPKIAERMAGLRTGDGRRGCDMGPLVTGAHRDKVAGYVAAGVDAGAALVVDGREVTPDGAADGFWLGPTLFDHVRPGMPVYDEEIFGPVLSVVRVSSYDEALALVNANEYGNGTAIFTGDGGAARRYSREVEVGMVGVNVPIPVPMAYYSFGGWKASLFGDTHAHGTEGIHFFTRAKVVTTRWPDPASRHGIDLGLPAALLRPPGRRAGSADAAVARHRRLRGRRAARRARATARARRVQVDDGPRGPRRPEPASGRWSATRRKLITVPPAGRGRSGRVPSTPLQRRRARVVTRSRVKNLPHHPALPQVRRTPSGDCSQPTAWGAGCHYPEVKKVARPGQSALARTGHPGPGVRQLSFHGGRGGAQSICPAFSSTSRRICSISSKCSWVHTSGGASWTTGSPRSSARQ